MFHQLSRRPGGFTLIELLVTLTIFGIMLAIGLPNASNWLLTNRARSAGEFYAEGFAMARREAVSHNTFSRISLTPNGNNGQFDWQVDICFVSLATACGPNDDGWSTTDTPSGNDPQGLNGFRSVFRNADPLPPVDVLQPSSLPVGTSQVYYTALGWVDTNFPDNLTRLRLDPAARYANEVPVVALSITLAGMPSKCNPTLPASDNRACPP
ncbi:pilus assembly FimT family protein [Duganella aceris]|jgi:type IV fimbrial biogenesis protein FimT|uniref:Prepilin-type N-terminal cleavage/methylation domain-containing protein n=1 Tax=Duganella aceris TaxID=2703883 RepID=A0ABX0FK72_9BURK|nr:prepilin-type N-terminal cleavage/methylation domain-containing protein [Duganella aceris]NGZ84966.1 prepilin-type N-terminal cleavage/methylation domain-containing protein [Duganella aceris]